MNIHSNQQIDSKFKDKWFDFMEYKPHKGQHKLHYPEKNKARFIVAVCGRRWGKSLSASMEASIVLAKPKTRVWVVAPTYDLSEKIFREIWHKMVVEKGMATSRASFKEQYIEFEWGSVLEGKSADRPDSLVGESLDLLIMDECAKVNRKIWEMYLRPTLSDKKGKAIFISTPEGFNHLYDWYLKGQNDKNWYSFRSPSWENNKVFPDGEFDEDIEEAKRNVTKEIFEQEYKGLFTALSGRVYNFDRNIDMGDYPYNSFLPTYCSIDWGYRMPSVGWFQTYMQNGEWHINMIDEISHQTNIKTDQLADMILSKKYNVVAYYGDPAGKQVQGQSGLGDVEIFRRKGIIVRSIRDKVSRSIASGISHVRSFVENAQGNRYLHLDKKCLGTAEDFEMYRYPEEKEGKALKPEPQKDGYSDHGMDMVRYFFINRFPIRQKEFKVRQR
jgi:hypothetical protein